MIVTGLVQIDRMKEEPKVIKGVFNFVSDKTRTIEKIGFNMKNNGKIMDSLKEFMEKKELLEITGKLFKEDKNFYISILDLKLCRTKYDLFNEYNNGYDGLGIE